jgi:hypothetical protein
VVEAALPARTPLEDQLASCPKIVPIRFSDPDMTPLADAETVRGMEGELAGSSATKSSSSSMERLPDGLLAGARFLQRQIARASSAARRFELQLRLVEKLLSHERSDIAMPIVELLLGAIETHRLVEWQPALCRRALLLAVQAARAAELDGARRAVLFSRVCQLAPADAVELGPELLPPT